MKSVFQCFAAALMLATIATSGTVRAQSTDVAAEINYQRFAEQDVSYEPIVFSRYEPLASQTRNVSAELSLVRQVLLRANPDLIRHAGNYRSLDFISELNATIYWSIPQVPSPADARWTDLDYFVLDSLSDGLGRQRGHICGGLSMNLATALAAFGVPHRSVGMFSALENYDAHVSVEVWLDDRWIVIDPTFNATFVDDAQNLLSWTEIHERCQAGQSVTPVYPESGHRQGNGVDDYYAPVCALTEYVVFSPAVDTPAEVLPGSWDGHVLQGGQPYNVVYEYTYNRIYTLAAMEYLYCDTCEPPQTPVPVSPTPAAQPEPEPEPEPDLFPVPPGLAFEDFDALYAVPEDNATELARVRALLLELNPRLGDIDPETETAAFASELMTTIYWSIPQIDSPADSSWYDLDHLVLDSLVQRRGHVSAGISINYVIGLAAFGVPHRAVGLFTATENYDSHVSVEVRVDGQWAVFDPTFNIGFFDSDGNRVSWNGVRRLCRDGELPAIEYARGGGRRGLSLEQYYAPVCDLVSYMVFSPVPGGEPVIVPAQWDGVVRQNGAPFDVAYSYQYSRAYTLAAQAELYD